MIQFRPHRRPTRELVHNFDFSHIRIQRSHDLHVDVSSLQENVGRIRRALQRLVERLVRHRSAQALGEALRVAPAAARLLLQVRP